MSYPPQIPVRSCSCYDCSLTAPARPAIATLRLERGSLADHIRIYAKYTAAHIFHSLAGRFDDSEQLGDREERGAVGPPPHIILALLGQTHIDWSVVWRSIWTFSERDNSLAAVAVTVDAAKEMEDQISSLAANAAVELMMHGFPRLEICRPHRIQVLARGSFGNTQQGYCLRVEHGRVRSQAGRTAFYETNAISPDPAQEELARLRLPRQGVSLMGDPGELALLEEIILAHEMMLSEWAVDDRLLNPATRWGSCMDFEAQRLERYFRTIRTIQEVFVLNELVLHCSKPVGSNAGLAHRARLEEHMRLRIEEKVLNARDEANTAHAMMIKRSKAFSVASTSSLYKKVVKDSWHADRSLRNAGSEVISHPSLRHNQPLVRGPWAQEHSVEVSFVQQCRQQSRRPFVQEPAPGQQAIARHSPSLEISPAPASTECQSEMQMSPPISFSSSSSSAGQQPQRVPQAGPAPPQEQEEALPIAPRSRGRLPRSRGPGRARGFRGTPRGSRGI